MNATAETVGVFGLGIIGGTWAGHLHEDGLLAACWNRTPKEDFPEWRTNPVGVAEKARVLIVVLSDPSAVSGLLDRILPALGPDHLVIQSTTIDPASSSRFEGEVTATGARYLEAPFTGSKPAAEARKVVYYLGGADEAAGAAEAVLTRLSETRIRIGAAPQAAALKLAMNLQIAIQAEALCESLAFARGAGIPDEIYFAALRKNAAWSGLTALKEPKLRERDYAPQFSVKHMLKDMRLLQAELARAPDGDFRLAAGIEQILAETAGSGHAEEDFIAMMKRFSE